MSDRPIRYHVIADELRQRVRSMAPGRVLPSESDLSAEFAVSRVTVRRALEILRDEGLVDSRQGFGWYIAMAPVPQRLNSLATIEGQLGDRGLAADRKILEYAFGPSTARAREVLGCDQVLRVKRLNLANGEPFAVVTVWCPAEIGHHFSRHDVEQRPFYELVGITLRGATQTIGADIVTAADAALLDVPPASPVLRCERITTDTGGRPVLLSEHVFPAYGGGSPGDGTFLAHELRIHSVARSFVCLYDPAAAELATKAGVGSRVRLSLGGHTDDLHGPPIEDEFAVMSLHDGVFTEPEARHGGFQGMDQGRSAVIQCGELTVLVNSKRTPPFSLRQLTSCGINPKAFQVLVAKGVNAPLAAYQPVCPNIVRVNTPGVTTADMESLKFKHRRHPMFPFER